MFSLQGRDPFTHAVQVALASREFDVATHRHEPFGADISAARLECMRRRAHAVFVALRERLGQRVDQFSRARFEDFDDADRETLAL